MQLDNYRQFGGLSPEMAALRNVLAFHRVRCRQSAEPPGEALLLGMAGGVGFTYATTDEAEPRLALRYGPRYRTRPGETVQALCVRAGLPASFRHTPDPAAALRNLVRSLDMGEPAIVFTDPRHLPHLALGPLERDYGDYPAVVYGVDDDVAVWMADRAPDPVAVPTDALAAARAALPALRHLTISVSPPAAPIDLSAALEAGLRACCDRLLDPPHPRTRFGLPALARWADLLTDEEDSQGWPAVFGRGPRLYAALRALFVQTRLSAAGPDAGRGLFAQCLRETALYLQEVDYEDVAQLYDELAVAWRGVAEAALPDGVPLLAETRELLLQRDFAFRERGPAAQAEMEAARDRLADIAGEVEASFPLRAGEVDALLADLAAQLRAVCAAEERAARALRLHLR